MNSIVLGLQPQQSQFHNSVSCNLNSIFSQLAHLFQTLNLIFYSSVIEDASPPTCTITWSGQYNNPTPVVKWGDPLPSPLPGCYVQDSREGYHMTYYWFFILDWSFYPGQD